MPLDIRQYLKTKQKLNKNPVLFLMELMADHERQMMAMQEKQKEELNEARAQIIEEINDAMRKLQREIENIELQKGDDGIDGTTPTKEELIALIELLMPAPIKGDKGEAPTDEELLSLIRPLIPRIKDGETPSDEKLLKLIRPLIPIVVDGETPSDERLLGLIKPLIPSKEELKGKDGSPDKGKDIVDKINSLELRPEFQIDASHIKNLPRMKTTKKLGGRLGGGGGTLEIITITGTINGVNTSFTLNKSFTVAFITLNGQLLPSSDFTISGTTLTLGFAPPTDSVLFGFGQP